jgi:hypothetical protein
MTKVITCAIAPCKSCPYRRDVPSGVWAAVEYQKLAVYDGTFGEQAMSAGKAGAFYCHQQNDKLCAGWLGTHGPGNLLALRLAAFYGNEIADRVWNYKSPVPVFRTGAQAAAHGMRALQRPGARAVRTIAQLLRKRHRSQTWPSGA